jgi:hypothetical protein
MGRRVDAVESGDGVTWLDVLAIFALAMGAAFLGGVTAFAGLIFGGK